jgi:hypothetical protein
MKNSDRGQQLGQARAIDEITIEGSDSGEALDEIDRL